MLFNPDIIDLGLNDEIVDLTEQRDTRYYLQYRHDNLIHLLKNYPGIADVRDNKGCNILHYILSHFYYDNNSMIRCAYENFPNNIQRFSNSGELPVHITLLDRGLSVKPLLYYLKLYPESICIRNRHGGGNTMYDTLLAKIGKPINELTIESCNDNLKKKGYMVMLRTLLRMYSKFNYALYVKLNYEARRMAILLAYSCIFNVNMIKSILDKEKQLYTEILTYL